MLKKYDSRSSTILAVIGVTASLGSPSAAWAWGSYGHQQVNAAAIEIYTALLPNSPVGKCLKQNDKLIQRLAITPDYDWKKLGTTINESFLPVSAADKKAAAAAKNYIRDPRTFSDAYEHPLHYFEVDAFLDPAKISALPSGPFSSVAQKYVDLRFSKERADFVVKVDPSKATGIPATEGHADPDKIDYVRSHGTAPWRIKQLYDLGVAQLKAGNLETAFIYLGAMGHYVGDMSQPFHTSLNFDGTYDSANPNDPRSPVFSSGIHAAFETDILMKATGAKPDPTTFLFPDFTVTAPKVAEYAKKRMSALKMKGMVKIPSANVVREVFNVIGTSTPYVQPLLDALWIDAQRCPVGHKICDGQPVGSTAVKATRRSPASTLGMTVLEVAEERISESALLLARLWYSAAIDAGKISVKSACKVFYDGSPDGHVAFREKVIKSYPIPTYLPVGHQQAAAHKAFEPKPAATDSTDEVRSGIVSVTSAPPVTSTDDGESPVKPSANAVKAFADHSL